MRNADQRDVITCYGTTNQKLTESEMVHNNTPQKPRKCNSESRR